MQAPPLSPAAEQWWQQLPERYRPLYLEARRYMYQLLPGLTDSWKYGTPFFEYAGRLLGYLNYHRSEKRFYLGFYYGKALQHPALEPTGIVARYYLEAPGALAQPDFAEVLLLAAAHNEALAAASPRAKRKTALGPSLPQ